MARDDENSLGKLLRRLRSERGLTLRQLAGLAHSNKTTLWRLEHGNFTRVDPFLVERLDEILDARGALVSERQSLLVGDAGRRLESPWKKRWVHHFPAAYAGEVFVNLVLRPSAWPATVNLQIRWGPWLLNRRVRVDGPDGVSCLFTKGDDGQSVPVFVRVDKPVSARFGIGVPPQPLMDINYGWRRMTSAGES